MPAGTGLQTPSGALTITGIVAGVLSAVEGVLTPGTTAHTAVYGGGGIIVGLGSVLGKLFHDKGIHVATIQQAGSDISASLPELQHDASIAASLVDEIPGLHGKIADLEAKVAAVNMPSDQALEAAVRRVLASVVPPAPATDTPAPA